MIMGHYLFKVIDTFWLGSGGLVLAADVKSADVSLSVGEPLELRRPDVSRLETEVAAIPILCPSDPDRSFSFSLPGGLQKGDVPVGTEVWSAG
jgi:hypothetical protein